MTYPYRTIYSLFFAAFILGLNACTSVPKDKRLQEEISKGKADSIITLVKQGADPNALNEVGNTPLIQAIMDQNEPAFKALIEAGADVNLPANDGMTPVMVVASSADNGTYQGFLVTLIASGANLNLEHPKEGRPLYMAIAANNPDFVKLLLKGGADPNLVHKNRTLLNIALARLHAHIAYQLVLNGANPVAAAENENYPLVNALNKLEDRDSSFITEILLKGGADMYKGKNGEVPLYMAAEKCSKETVGAFMKNGANIDYPDSARDTILMRALRNKDLCVTQLALEHNASPVVKNRKGETPVALALLTADRRFIEPFIAKGAITAETKDKRGYSLLIIGTEAQNVELLQYALSLGVNPTYKNRQGTSAYTIAFSQENQPMLKYLPGGTTTNIFEAVEFKSLEMIDYHLTRGDDVNSENEFDGERKTPLILAVELSDIPSIRLLLNRRANVNVFFGKPLRLAVQADNMEIIKILIAAGARVNEQYEANGTSGPTALSIAVENGNYETVRYLLNRGASVDQAVGTRQVTDGFSSEALKTPLMQAASQGKAQIVELLLSWSANSSSIVREYRVTPLMYGVYSGNSEVVGSILRRASNYYYVNFVNHSSDSALSIAHTNRHKEIEQLLLDAGAFSRSSQ